MDSSDLGLIVVSNMDCLGLAADWERCEELRTRIRDQKKVLTKQPQETFVQPNRANAVQNAIVLRPIMARMGATESFRLPHLQDLMLQVTTLMEKCGLDAGPKEAYRTSVEIKKLCSFVKRRSQRQEVTKD